MYTAVPISSWVKTRVAERYGGGRGLRGREETRMRDRS